VSGQDRRQATNSAKPIAGLSAALAVGPLPFAPSAAPRSETILKRCTLPHEEHPQMGRQGGPGGIVPRRKDYRPTGEETTVPRRKDYRPTGEETTVPRRKLREFITCKRAVLWRWVFVPLYLFFSYLLLLLKEEEDQIGEGV
jgi:hypothetical protein